MKFLDEFSRLSSFYSHAILTDADLKKFAILQATIGTLGCSSPYFSILKVVLDLLHLYTARSSDILVEKCGQHHGAYIGDKK